MTVLYIEYIIPYNNILINRRGDAQFLVYVLQSYLYVLPTKKDQKRRNVHKIAEIVFIIYKCARHTPARR